MATTDPPRTDEQADRSSSTDRPGSEGAVSNWGRGRMAAQLIALSIGAGLIAEDLLAELAPVKAAL